MTSILRLLARLDFCRVHFSLKVF